MNDILNGNLRLLEKHQPHVYRKLTGYLNKVYSPVNNFVERIILARQDDLIINMLVISNGREYLLCDHEDPIGQSYAWIDKYIDPSNRADIVFGMGMGFHLEVLITSFKNKKLIIIEPNIELFYQILCIRDMELIIRNSELFIDEDADVILSRVYALYWDTEKGGIQCQPFEVYGEMFADLWDTLRDKFIRQAENFTVDIATRRRFGELWIYNNIKNSSRIGNASNAEGLADSFQGIPGILVSAGPSLAKNVHLLNNLKDKCVIMAAGTGVKVMERYGFAPHFMTGIDASEMEADIHRNIKSDDIYFIYSNQVATGSVENYRGPKFFMNFPVDMYTAEFLRFAEIKSQFFFSGPSVANTCADILFKMGCNPIILLGQDLAYTDGSLYAGDASGSSFKSGEEALSEGYILQKDVYGNDVYTDTSFIAMRNWFEGYFEKIGDKVDIINATEGGINIQFARNEKLENVINSYNFGKQDIESRIKDIYDNSHFPENISDNLSKYRESVVAEISKLEEYSKKQLKLVDLVKRDIYHPSKDKRAFDKIANRISQLTDQVTESSVYNTLLRNIIEMDFFLIKQQVDRATKELSSYDEVKDIYINAITLQNQKLMDKLCMVKKFLTE